MAFREACLLVLVIGCGSSSPPHSSPVTVDEPPVVDPEGDDLDADNVFGDDDACADERETYNGWVDDDGCPDMSHSGAPRRPDLPAERVVTGPERPADCEIFRRLRSPAGQLERWVVLAEPGAESLTAGTSDVARIAHVVGELGVDLEVVAVLGDGESREVAGRRAEWFLAHLVDSGVRADGLRLADEMVVKRGVAGVTFRVIDRAHVTRAYVCYSR